MTEALEQENRHPPRATRDGWPVFCPASKKDGRSPGSGPGIFHHEYPFSFWGGFAVQDLIISQ